MNALFMDHGLFVAFFFIIGPYYIHIYWSLDLLKILYIRALYHNILSSYDMLMTAPMDSLIPSGFANI